MEAQHRVGAEARQELQRVYEKHKDSVYAYARSLDADACEDLAAEAFSRYLARLRTGAEPEDPCGFLLATVRNLFIDSKRTQTRRSAKRREIPVRQREADPDERAAGGERAEILRRAVEALPPEFQQVVVLHAWAGRTFEEIARMTDTPLGTVLGRYRNALGKLREGLPEGVP